jgi:hypothetical protein
MENEQPKSTWRLALMGPHVVVAEQIGEREVIWDFRDSKDAFAFFRERAGADAERFFLWRKRDG